MADAAVARPEVWVSHKLGEETYSFGAIQIKGSDWQLISVIPYSEIRAASNAIRMQMVFIMAVIALCAWIAAYLVADSITRRINLLTKHIKKVQEGDFSVIVNMKGSDEISELAHNYNYMLEQLERYARLQFQSGADLKAAELKALQAQINPHFLYNTLDSIIWMSEAGRNDEVVLMTSALARLFRQSISNDKEQVTIAEEIEYVRSYLTIQKMRYKDKLEYSIDVSPEINHVMIIKFALQPLVENAIYHGLKYKETKGNLSIRGYVRGKKAYITIADDGVGMEEAALEHIFDETKKEHKSNGVGVPNVQKRLEALLWTGIWDFLYQQEGGWNSGNRNGAAGRAGR